MKNKIAVGCLAMFLFFLMLGSECPAREIPAATNNQKGFINNNLYTNRIDEIPPSLVKGPDFNGVNPRNVTSIETGCVNSQLETAQLHREKSAQSGKKPAAQSPAIKEYIGMCSLAMGRLPEGGISITPTFKDATSCKNYTLEERVPGSFFLTDSPVPCRVTGYIKGNTIVYDSIKRIIGNEIEDIYNRHSLNCGGPSYDSLMFKSDPEAQVKFTQIHDIMVFDSETILKNKIAEMLKKGDRHFISILDVIIKDNTRFLNATITWDNSIKIMLIIRTGEGKATVNTRSGHHVVNINDLDRTDLDINKAIEIMQKSDLPNPAVLIIDNKFFDEESADIFMSGIARETAKGLEKYGFDIKKGSLLFSSSVPNYLIGDGKKFKYFDLFNSFRKKDYGRLSDLIVLEGENPSRDHYTNDNKPKYLFISTKNSAPIEMKESDLMKIASIQDSNSHGLRSVALTLKNGIMITFGGLSAVNKDFMKSDNKRWNTVVGLSSPNGFYVSIQHKQGKNVIKVSGDEVRKNTQNIQDKLPTSVVEMILLALRD